MNRPADELERMMRRFDAVIRDAGVKRTPQRREIFRQAAATTDHPDIEAVLRGVRRTMPHVSLDTVYRALAVFSELGLISTVRPQGRNHVRFDANTARHHHFVCSRCGAVLDFADRDFDNLRVPASAATLGKVVSRHVELRGLCAFCAAGAPGATRASARRPIGTKSHRTYNKTARRD
jgi:Fur family peroxide stress response transcriptional regulator